jgi:hypothetical protein
MPGDILLVHLSSPELERCRREECANEERVQREERAVYGRRRAEERREDKRASYINKISADLNLSCMIRYVADQCHAEEGTTVVDFRI